MGIFDSLRGKAPVQLNARSAMLLACISMIGADGDIDDDELAIVMRIDGGAPTDSWNKAVEAWQRVSSAHECVPLVAPQLDPDQRKFTMANLVDIAMADGALAGSERDLLEAYVQAFSLDEAFVGTLVDVIGTKNDRSIF